MNDDILVLADEGRHHQPDPVVEDRGLVAFRRGLAVQHRLGLDHLADDFLRQGHVQRLVAVILHGHGHAVLQEGAAVAQQVGGQFDLLEALAVHEGQHAVGFKEELLVLAFQPDLIDLVLRAETLVQLAAVAEVLQLHLGKGTALAGLHDIDLHRDPQPAVMLQHVAGPDFVAIDLGHGENSWGGDVEIALTKPISCGVHPRKPTRCGHTRPHTPRKPCVKCMTGMQQIGSESRPVIGKEADARKCKSKNKDGNMSTPWTPRPTITSRASVRANCSRRSSWPRWTTQSPTTRNTAMVPSRSPAGRARAMAVRC